MNVEVSIDHKRRDSFVYVSSSFRETCIASFFGGMVPQVVPLRLEIDGGSDGSVRDVFVGCLADQPHGQQKQKIVMSYFLARDLGLDNGAAVRAVPLTSVPRATRVLVAPLNVDESEVVEFNALRIEMVLLQQVQVVFPGMVLTVCIAGGVQARVRVEEVECGEGNRLQSGPAAMHEGVHFVVATRSREAAASSTSRKKEQALPPRWGLVRAVPSSGDDGSGGGDVAEGPSTGNVLLVPARVASEHHWRSGDAVELLDVARLLSLAEDQVTTTFLRAHTVAATLRVADDSDVVAQKDSHACRYISGTSAVGASKYLLQATNVLVQPGSPYGAEAVAVSPAPPSLLASAAAVSAATLPVSALAEVHGGVPAELQRHFAHVFSAERVAGQRRRDGANGGPWRTTGNVLLSGGKGYGKTTVLCSVLAAMPNIHVVLLECAGTTEARITEALKECVLCAPAALILDNFDSIAPEQKDGNAQAMSEATQALLEATLLRFGDVLSTTASGGAGGVVVAATCNSREAVHESLRSALCFDTFAALPALTRSSRCNLLAQLFPSAAATGEVAELAALMDNYTPFDVRQIAHRISRDGADGKSLKERAEASVATFVPLAHTGIKFLKGERKSWDSVGGLTQAKKVLYDTLVLPLKHPELFARLPLKARSGILLYGPSGCGKTYIIESLVNAENINCIVVNGPEVFGKYIGQSEQKIRDVFERAQAAAPCVVFFDEFDSVAPQRGLDNTGVTDRVVNQLLCYLDGVEGRKDVYVVAASSRPDLIDAALLRPGRLDKAVQCPIPSPEDRRAIFRSLCATAGIECTDEMTEHVVAQTERWTPADISAMVSTVSTTVSQRVINEVLQRQRGSSPGAAGQGPSHHRYDTSQFFIANVGGDATEEKVSDSLRFLESPAGKLSGEADGTDGGSGGGGGGLLAGRVTLDDVKAAVADTRPSLSEKDIVRQQKIHALFSKEEPVTPVAPGTKLTFV